MLNKNTMICTFGLKKWENLIKPQDEVQKGLLGLWTKFMAHGPLIEKIKNFFNYYMLILSLIRVFHKL